MWICRFVPSYYRTPANLRALQTSRGHQSTYPGELLSFVHVTMITLSCMSVRHLGSEKCRPSGTLSRTARVAQLRRDYTLFGKKRCYMWLLSYTTNAALRICIPMSDLIHGQVDEGVKMLLDTGGEVAQRDLPVEMNQ